MADIPRYGMVCLALPVCCLFFDSVVFCSPTLRTSAGTELFANTRRMVLLNVTCPLSRVLKSLAKHMPFELAAGLNGAFWVDSGEHACHHALLCYLCLLYAI